MLESGVPVECDFTEQGDQVLSLERVRVRES